MANKRVMMITGTSRGIGRFLALYYLRKGFHVIGLSRKPGTIKKSGYRHYCLDVSDEKAVMALFASVRREHGRLDVLINNAGIASMNSALLTPISQVRKIMETNFIGPFLFSREAAKIMMRHRSGRIVNFATVAVPLLLEGEAAYVASKAAVLSLSQVMAREFAPMGITVNTVGPTPIPTDLIKSVPKKKLDALLARQAIHRYGRLEDVTHTVDFFIRAESDFITGQVLYLGGV